MDSSPPQENTNNLVVTGPDPSSDFHVVALGASAGGLKALEEFFRAVPGDINMCFIVVQHLSPKYKSVMPELLARHTTLDVQHAENGAKIVPGTVRLISPGKNLTIREGRLYLSDQPVIRGVNLPIDILFRSLAVDFADRVICIILSGTGTDGTLGLREIKGVGGLALVQEPTTAQFDGMPRSAIATRMVDFVMPPEEMPQKLVEYASYAGTATSFEKRLPRSGINRLLGLLEGHTGIDFGGYRQSTFLRRLDRRMQMSQITELDEYLQYIQGNVRELDCLYQDVLIGVTRFFRDEDAWRLLREEVIPALWARHIANVDEGERAELRVWCAGCSTGEEAYSLAVVLDEAARAAGIQPNFKVFATDADKQAIRVAGAGSYPESVTADIPTELLAPYFHRKADRYVINDRLRQKVIFSLHDVTRNPPFNRIDLLSCRNMLIYLTSEVQQKVLSNFCYSLKKSGVLFLGPSESMGDLDVYFTKLDQRAKLYTYDGGVRPSLIQSGLSIRQTPSTDGMKASEQTSYSKLERNVFRQVMMRYAPATAIVNDRHSVLMTFGPMTKYLKLPPGRVSFDLLGMADGTLGALLATGLHKARQSRTTVTYQGIRIGAGATAETVNLSVEMLSREGRVDELYAIVIDPRSPNEASATTDELGEQEDTHFIDLQRELQYTKENLQATIEELETSNEELQATNEELLASNEELQSTNEELQSVNEELITVNAEHQLRIEDLTQSHNDFDNLLLTAQIHTIFLDRDLRIRKFSQGDGPFNLLESDIGRSIRDFSTDLEFPDFFPTIEGVRETLAHHQGVYAGPGTSHYLVRIVPYRTREDEIRGTVITMIDVTDRHELQERLHTLERENALHGRPIRLMLVEDDEDQTALMAATLEAQSITNEVQIANDGQTAIAMLREAAALGDLPDLVLLDLGLPDMDGFDVLRAIKADVTTKDVTVVIISAADDQRYIDLGYELGATSYLAKPLTAERLTEAVVAMGNYWLSMVRLPTPPLDRSEK